MFDTADTLIDVTHRARLLDENGQLPRLRTALLPDSLATVASAALGTSTTTSYTESAAGMRAGPRTGLTAVDVAVLFLGCLFFAPLAGSVPTYARAPALLFVACMMARGLSEINWDDVTDYVTAVVTALTMPLTFSTATGFGIGIGFITYAAVKVLSGRRSEATPAILILAGAFVFKFAFL